MFISGDKGADPQCTSSIFRPTPKDEDFPHFLKKCPWKITKNHLKLLRDGGRRFGPVGPTHACRPEEDGPPPMPATSRRRNLRNSEDRISRNLARGGSIPTHKESQFRFIGHSLIHRKRIDSFRGISVHSSCFWGIEPPPQRRPNPKEERSLAVCPVLLINGKRCRKVTDGGKGYQTDGWTRTLTGEDEVRAR